MTTQTDALLTLEAIRQVVREVRDEKPTGWQAYAAACVAAMEYREVTVDAGWRVKEQVKLDDAAFALRTKQ